MTRSITQHEVHAHYSQRLLSGHPCLHVVFKCIYMKRRGFFELKCITFVYFSIMTIEISILIPSVLLAFLYWFVLWSLCTMSFTSMDNIVLFLSRLTFSIMICQLGSMWACQSSINSTMWQFGSAWFGNSNVMIWFRWVPFKANWLRANRSVV